MSLGRATQKDRSMLRDGRQVILWVQSSYRKERLERQYHPKTDQSIKHTQTSTASVYSNNMHVSACAML